VVEMLVYMLQLMEPRRTLADYVSELRKVGFHYSTATVCRILKHLGLSRKKVHYKHV
jgi:transposase